MNSFSFVALIVHTSWVLLVGAADNKYREQYYARLGMSNVNPLAALIVAARANSLSQKSKRPMSAKTPGEVEKKSWSSLLTRTPVTRHSSLQSLPSVASPSIQLDQIEEEYDRSIAVPQGLIRQHSAPTGPCKARQAQSISIPKPPMSRPLKPGPIAPALLHRIDVAQKELAELEEREKQVIKELSSSIPTNLSVPIVTVTNEPVHVKKKSKKHVVSREQSKIDLPGLIDGIFLMELTTSHESPCTNQTKKNSGK